MVTEGLHKGGCEGVKGTGQKPEYDEIVLGESEEVFCCPCFVSS